MRLTALTCRKRISMWKYLNENWLIDKVIGNLDTFTSDHVQWDVHQSQDSLACASKDSPLLMVVNTCERNLPHHTPPQLLKHECCVLSIAECTLPFNWIFFSPFGFYPFLIRGLCFYQLLQLQKKGSLNHIDCSLARLLISFQFGSWHPWNSTDEACTIPGVLVEAEVQTSGKSTPTVDLIIPYAPVQNAPKMFDCWTRSWSCDFLSQVIR